jgi:GT2 family glycosyltransferase
MSAPWISVIVPARNAASTLGACLGSIREAASTSEGVELFVADNGSTDSTRAIAAADGSTVLSLPDIRVSAVRNRAAQVAQAPLLAFIDADHVLGPGWFAAARHIFADEDIAAAGAEYLTPGDGTWVQRTYDRLRRHLDAAADVTWLPSGNLVIRSDEFRKIGGFDEGLETCEDVDLCRRLAAARSRLVADPRLVSVHLGDPRTLSAVYLGEMWRGRDNLRVTLRPPRNLRSMLSALQPLATIVVVVAAVALALADTPRAFRWLSLGAGLVVAASIPRMLQMAVRGADRSPASLIQIVAVALAFDLGRASAIVARATHGARAQAPEVLTS